MRREINFSPVQMREIKDLRQEHREAVMEISRGLSKSESFTPGTDPKNILPLFSAGGGEGLG